MGKSKYLDSLVELDHHVGVVIDKVRELGIEQDTLVIWTTDNGAWQDVYPDCGYTPFRGTKGTDYEGAAGCRRSPGGQARSNPAGATPTSWARSTHGNVRQLGRARSAERGP